jgi:hypothetical protein
LQSTYYNVAINKGGEKILAQNSRADYFKKRREGYKLFSAEVERNKLDVFDACIAEKGKTRKGWLNEKIDEEIGKK